MFVIHRRHYREHYLDGRRLREGISKRNNATTTGTNEQVRDLTEDVGSCYVIVLYYILLYYNIDQQGGIESEVHIHI